MRLGITKRTLPLGRRGGATTYCAAFKILMPENPMYLISQTLAWLAAISAFAAATISLRIFR
jgi:hypothetical protein